MSLLGRMMQVHILNATPHIYARKSRLGTSLAFIILACLLILLGKLT